MGRTDTTTMNFDCDWKCGASYETTDRHDLIRNHIPPGWEQVNKMSSAAAVTSEYKGIPYLLCPKCWNLFELLRKGGTSPSGKRLRLLLEEFDKAEQVHEARAWDDEEDPFA
jgi:hypothetical protein